MSKIAPLQRVRAVRGAGEGSERSEVVKPRLEDFCAAIASVPAQRGLPHPGANRRAVKFGAARVRGAACRPSPLVALRVATAAAGAARLPPAGPVPRGSALPAPPPSPSPGHPSPFAARPHGRTAADTRRPTRWRCALVAPLPHRARAVPDRIAARVARRLAGRFGGPSRHATAALLPRRLASTRSGVLPLLALFVLAQLGVGLWASRRIGTEDDYLVAGRRLGPFLATTSIFATWFGAESCIGAAGNAYSNGLQPDTTEPFAYGLCLVLMGLFFAARLHGERITTLADFFRRRFGAGSERLAAVLLLPSSLLWAAAQVRAFGHIVASNSDGALTEVTATWIAAAVAVVYTVSGGLLADVYTDVVQGALLLLGIAALAIAVWCNVPEVAAAGPAAAAAAAAGPTSVLAIAESWSIPLCGSVVAQEVLSRCLAARTPTIARRAALAGGAIYLLVGVVPLAIGLVGPRLAPDLADPEALLPRLGAQLLPSGLNLLFAGALISAILSTVDSCFLVAAAIVVRNLMPHRGPSAATHAPTGNDDRDSGASAQDPAAAASTAGNLARARMAAGAAGGVALALALSRWNVKELVEQASGFGSTGVFVLAVFGVYTRFGGPRAAVGALLAGLGSWIVGGYVATDHVPYPYLTSLAAALAGFAGGGLLDRRADRRVAATP
jgi:Na+/proline symporter